MRPHCYFGFEVVVPVVIFRCHFGFSEVMFGIIYFVANANKAGVCEATMGC